MNETIKKSGVNSNVQLIEVCGLQALQRALKNLDVEKLDKTIFIEALACEGGCVGGNDCINTIRTATKTINEFTKNSKPIA